MAVDIRQRFRAYRVGMRFFRDDPSRITFVRWYSVPDTTPPVPFANQFYSRRWERGLPELPIGEPLNWLGLARDFPPAGITGLHACGSAEQWLNGCLTTDPLPPINPANGLRVCCGSSIQVGRGGEAEGGNETIPIPGCPDAAPSLMYCGISLMGTPTNYFGTGTFYWNSAGFWICLTDWLFPTGFNLRGSRLYPPPDVFHPWRMLFSKFLIPHFLVFQGCGPNWAGFTGNNIPTPIDSLFTFSSNRFFSGFELGQGGEAEGGRAWILIPPLQLARGGEAEGGEGSSQQAQLAQGGEAEGGTASSARNFTGQGGEAEGGEGVVLPLEYAQGGEAEGGSGFLIPLQLGAGGEAEGGSASP